MTGLISSGWPEVNISGWNFTKPLNLAEITCLLSLLDIFFHIFSRCVHSFFSPNYTIGCVLFNGLQAEMFFGQVTSVILSVFLELVHVHVISMTLASSEKNHDLAMTGSKIFFGHQNLTPWFFGTSPQTLKKVFLQFEETKTVGIYWYDSSGKWQKFDDFV